MRAEVVVFHLLRFLRRWAGAGLVTLGLAAGSASAQELTPRAYSPNPTGGNLLVLAYGHSKGGVLFDPAVRFDDVKATINSGSLVYGRTLGFFGRSASAQVTLPYVLGEMNGLVQDEFTRINRSGLADLRGKFTVNLLGGPALTPREFAASHPTTILGVSVGVSAPTGQYDRSKLINVGSNRWAIKPEIGVSKTVGPWYAEVYGGAWFFGTNTDFFGGSIREQAPIGTFQIHASHTFKPRLWVAVDATFFTGGRTTVDGASNADLQANSRLGVTLAVPFRRLSTLRVSWSTGFTTRVGADFDTLAVALQLVWFETP